MRKWLVPIVVCGLFALTGCGITNQASKSEPTQIETKTQIDAAIKAACATFGVGRQVDIFNLSSRFGALGRIAPQYQPMADMAVEADDLSQRPWSTLTPAQINSYDKDFATLRSFCSGVK
jgi:hypothetical protein